MEAKYIIIHMDHGMKLAQVYLEKKDGAVVGETAYTIHTEEALVLNQEEAKAVIDFITNVIDWEAGEQLLAIPLKD